MKETIIAKFTAPVCFFPDGKLLCFHRGKLIVMRDGATLKTIRMPISLLERLLGWSRLATRLLRFGIRVAEAIDDKHAIICVGNTLYELDIESGLVSKGWHCGNGIRPLIMTTVKSIDGFEDGIYFGGYLMNMNKDPVHIYHRTGVDNWEVVYTFPKGAINHIHNVVPDPYRQCLWIFTGDFDESAAIWKATDGFVKMECIANHDQKYRGCVAYTLPEGVLYATDAPFADNYIYLMNTETFVIQSIFSLHGSCIYGCQWGNKYVLSSTVESDGRTPDGINPFYHGNRGSGIKDDFVHLYIGDLKEGFCEIYKERKDSMSFLFQLGVFKFPYGVNNTDTLYLMPMSTKENDMNMLKVMTKE